MVALRKFNCAIQIVAYADNGKKIRYYATNDCGTTNSTPVTITVNSLPDNTGTGFSSSSFCIGNQATITFNANNGSGKLPYTISYRNDATPSITYSETIMTNNPTTFNLSPNPAVTARYTLLSITDANGCVNIAPNDRTAEVKILSLPSKPTIGPVTQPTCAVATGSFTITNYDVSYTYAINPNTGVSQSGSVITAPVGNYTLTATLGACTSLSSANVGIIALETNTWKIISGVTKWDKGIPKSNQNLVFEADYPAASTAADLEGWYL